MDRFHVIDDAAVIIRSKGGVYKQAKVYRRGSDLYAAHAGGFIRLMGGRGTSHPSVSWDEIEAGDEVTVDKLGRLTFRQKLAIAS
jgi:hypothetical protein